MTVPSLILASGDFELELSPEIGGSIVRFDCRQVPVLRQCTGPLKNVLDAASFPLIPYVNRIRDGCFDFRGRQVRLQPNMSGDPSPLHGQGWLAPWQVEEPGPVQATLYYRHDGGEWPWAYESRQHFRLDDDGLETAITCRNISDEPMPCGLGIHPYFNCGPQTRIRTTVADVWAVDDKVLPVEKLPATGRYAIADDPVCGRDLDNGYDGWGGEALFSDPDWPFDVILSSPGTRFFQLYSPTQGGIFVAEPVTHANDALSQPEEDWAALGIRILEPGEEMELRARIDVRRS